MDGASYTEHYLRRVRQRKRATRWLVVAGVVLLALVAFDSIGLLLRGPCEYQVAREGAPVPDLAGRTVEEARRDVRAMAECLTVDVAERRSSSQPSGTVLEQRPAWPSWTTSTTVEVVVAE